jgi:hypothetical protein
MTTLRRNGPSIIYLCGVLVALMAMTTQTTALATVHPLNAGPHLALRSVTLARAPTARTQSRRSSALATTRCNVGKSLGEGIVPCQSRETAVQHC